MSLENTLLLQQSLLELKTCEVVARLAIISLNLDNQRRFEYWFQAHLWKLIVAGTLVFGAELSFEVVMVAPKLRQN